MARIKPNIQRVLRLLGVLQRLKVSWIYDLYWKVVDARRIDRRSAEVAFYRQLLKGFPKGGVIYDIGANAGEKTDVFLRLGARVVAVEPDELNQQIITEKFLKLRFTPKSVAVVGKAVSDQCAIETMWIDAPGSALNTFSPKWVNALRAGEHQADKTPGKPEFAGQKDIHTTTLEQLVVTHGQPFFIKIDVEGYEANVLRGLQHPVPFVSFEVNLPEFRSEGMECIELLERVCAEGTFNYALDCQNGLLLEQWLGPRQFSSVLDRCSAGSVEVFWKVPWRDWRSLHEHGST